MDMTARIDKAKIKKYDHLLGICHRRAQDEQDPELREAFSVYADFFGTLIMEEEGRIKVPAGFFDSIATT